MNNYNDEITYVFSILENYKNGDTHINPYTDKLYLNGTNEIPIHVIKTAINKWNRNNYLKSYKKKYDNLTKKINNYETQLNNLIESEKEDNIYFYVKWILLIIITLIILIIIVYNIFL